MAIHNKSHHNSALMSINHMNKNNIRNKSNIVFEIPKKIKSLLIIEDCFKALKKIPDKSIQFILLDPPYNLDLADWDTYNDYMSWAARWLDEAYRILADNGNMVIFGGTQFRDEKSGDLIEIIHYCRHNTNWKLINTIIWYYKNGMSAHRYFANRHEEIIWLTKDKNYYFDLDSVRVKYTPEELKEALKDKRLNPENTKKGKNPTNVWEMGRLNGNSLERVGHPTQKPLEVIRRLVKALSYPGANVLDFFAGSGTTGRVCIEESRNCIMIDKDKKTVDYFKEHIKNMKKTGVSNNYEIVKSLKSFFNATNV